MNFEKDQAVSIASPLEVKDYNCLGNRILVTFIQVDSRVCVFCLKYGAQSNSSSVVGLVSRNKTRTVGVLVIKLHQVLFRFGLLYLWRLKSWFCSSTSLKVEECCTFFFSIQLVYIVVLVSYVQQSYSLTYTFFIFFSIIGYYKI